MSIREYFLENIYLKSVDISICPDRNCWSAFMFKLVLTALTLVLLCSLCANSYADNELGKAIYDKSCQTCHNPNTAPLMLAPAAHNLEDWKLRFENAEVLAKKNPKEYPNALAVLIASVKNGKGTMVAGGMCQDQSTPDKQCTDADYAATINFMSNK